jgi:outer membrane protein assembly factor BamB
MNEDRSLVLIALDSEIVALRRTDGAVAWRQTFPVRGLFGSSKEEGAMELVIHGGRVYAALDRRLVCLDYATGAVVGQAEIPEGLKRPVMLFDDGQLFITGASETACFDLSGRLAWRTEHGLASMRHSATVALPGNVARGDVSGWER